MDVAGFDVRVVADHRWRRGSGCSVSGVACCAASREASKGAPIVTPLWNSLQASGLAAIATVLMALPVAFVTVRYRNWLSDLFGKAVYIGFGLPGVVVALSLVFFAVNFALVAYQTLLLLVFAYAVLFLPVALGSFEIGD